MEICSTWNILYMRECMYKVGMYMKRSGCPKMGIVKIAERVWPILELGVETKLLGEPFAQPLFGLFLRKRALLMGVVQAAPHFVEDIQMVLNVFKRAILRQLAEERFDLLFGVRHIVI